MKLKLISALLLLTLLCSAFLVACDGSSSGTSEGSVGLEYKVNDDGETCTITGMGTCTDTDVKIPEKIDGLEVVAIAANAFAKNKDLTSVVIAFGTKTIATNAFLECPSLAYIVLPATVENIRPSAFRGCSLLSKIYYEGAQSDWGDIKVGDNNDPISSVNVLYYSEATPQNPGSYWHYVDDKPTKW